MKSRGGDFVRQMPEATRDFTRLPSLANRLHLDLPLLGMLLAIAAFGLVVLYSANGQQFAQWQRQASMFGISFLLLFIVLAIWLLPKVWRGVVALFARLGRWLGRSPAPDRGASGEFEQAAQAAIADLGGRDLQPKA